MRISDWSSDVCSSDLMATTSLASTTACSAVARCRCRCSKRASTNGSAREDRHDRTAALHRIGGVRGGAPGHAAGLRDRERRGCPARCLLDRKSVVKGKSVSVGVDLGGCCLLKKKTKKKTI